MRQPLILLLLAIACLASCSNEYQPKNETEKVILAYIKDSLAIEGDVMQLFVYNDIDTVRQYTAVYADKIKNAFPNTADPLATFDSIKARQQWLRHTADSIFARGIDNLSEQELDFASNASSEGTELQLLVIEHGRLVKEYRKLLSANVDSLITINVDGYYKVGDKGTRALFVLSGDGSKVVSYTDITAEDEQYEREQQNLEIENITGKRR